MTSLIHISPKTKIEQLNQEKIDAVKVAKTTLPTWKSPPSIIMPKKQEHVSMAQATISLQNILNQFGSQEVIPLSSLEKIPMDSLILMSTNLGIALFSDSARAISKSISIQTDIQTDLRNQQVKDYQKQLAKNIEAADKAKKGGIVQVVFDWAISTAEVVYGAAKVGAAVLSGDAVGGASGAAYMMAGFSGMVKAIAETLILTGVGDKKELEKVIEVAGKIQLAMEIAGAVIDMYQAGKGVMAARSTTAATKTAMVEATPQIVAQVNGAAAGTITEQAAKEATKVIAEEAAAQISQEIATQMIADLPKQMSQQMAEAMAKTLAKETGEQAVKVTSKEVTEALVKESLKRTIQNTIEKAAEQAIEKGIEITAENFASQITKEVGKKLTLTFINMAASKTLNIIQGVSAGSQKIASSVIQSEINELHKKVQELIAQQDLAQWCFQWYEDMKKEEKDRMNDSVSKQGDSLEIGSKLLSQSANIQASIAGTTI